jgi:TolB-like protein
MVDQPDAPAQLRQSTPTDVPLDSDADKLRKKRNKVRSAWISFVGRIVAQIMGAAATITLGLMVVQRYPLPVATTSAGDGKGMAAVQAPARAARPDGLSIAVLPLETYSWPARQELADAMTEAVIADLSRTKDLRVISRTSSMQYRSQRKALPVIGRELAVDMILEGSITSHGDRVRIIAQLIDAKSDEHIWTASYDRSMKDMLAVQADVATAITKGIQEALRGIQSTAGRRPRDAAPAPVSGSGSVPSSGDTPSSVPAARPTQ